MSDENFRQPNSANPPKQGGKKLVKVKRFKPKNNGAPRPEDPSYNNNYANRSLTTLSRPKNRIEESYNQEEYSNAMSNSYSNETPQYIQEDEDYAGGSPIVRMIYDQPVRMLAIAAVFCFIIGFGIAKLITPSAGGAVKEGLQGVVVNPEVPKGRARCGLVDRTQGCVIYIMNPQRQDLNARDFFDLAAKQTGRQRFVIDTANMRYSNVKIKPGAIAQINIPPL